MFDPRGSVEDTVKQEYPKPENQGVARQGPSIDTIYFVPSWDACYHGDTEILCAGE